MIYYQIGKGYIIKREILTLGITSILLVGSLKAEILHWGDSTKIGISKKDIEKLIKDYVDKNYPKEVEEYYAALKEIKNTKLKKYKDLIFIDNGLMWEDNINNIDLKLSVLEAKIYCKRLHLATKKDWRLPKYDELLSLINYYRYEPANIDGMSYVNKQRYWTSSMSSTDVSASWFVDFTYGETNTALKYAKYNVRCVRTMSDKPGEF